jgi:phosphoribosylformylglycinamidine synthase
MNISRIEIGEKVAGAVSKRALQKLQKFNSAVKDVRVLRVLTIRKDLNKTDLEKIAESVINPVTEDFVIGAYEIGDFDYALEIGYLPGVTDNIAHTSKELVSDLLDTSFEGQDAIASSSVYFIKGDLKKEDLEFLAISISNPLIERHEVLTSQNYKAENGFKPLIPDVKLSLKDKACLEVDLNVSEEELEAIGRQGVKDENGQPRGPLALSLEELKVIKEYFDKEGRKPKDIELEAIAQTWSEHCKHKIFASEMDEITDGLYKHYIKRATNEIRANKGEKDFCVSVFKDNSGAIEFNEKYYITDKAETHNSPSALDPYGGSITGIVGVNRDTLGFGLGAKPIANRYGFCFADPRDDKPLYRGVNQTNQMLPPARIIEGVVAGVEAGGNQSGIPAPQGFVYFDERYKGKPLVFVGTVGLIPKEIQGSQTTEKEAQADDLIVVIGGRVGLDGIHGATFSSESLNEGSPSTAVQIGDPITQKRLMDAVLQEARDKKLYNSITDNGAGGISCSVAEMARECGGCTVELNKVPLKYANLDPWEIWISESQERMTLSVSEKNWPEFEKIMKKHGVEASVIGKFNDSGRCIVNYKGEEVLNLDMHFLHDGVPLTHLKTEEKRPDLSEPEVVVEDYNQELLTLLERLNIASYANISTMFDHEVQGGSIIKPLQGRGKVNSKATVVKPDYDSFKGAVMSQGINPRYSDIDTYHMAACAIDTAIRNAVSVGANIDHLALMDNFCWCSSNEPFRLWQLKEAAKACYEYAVAYGTPYISGKDSMFNDFKGFDHKGEKVKISVPPTLLVSSLSVTEDIRKCLTLDPKVIGDLVYIIGETKDELGASEFYAQKGHLGANIPQVDADKSLTVYRQFYQGVEKELMASAISVEAGGIAAALAKMAVAGKLGLQISLEGLSENDTIALFSESQGRFIVTVNPELKDQFEANFGGSYIKQIGEVKAARSLSITGVYGDNVIENSIENLREKYFSANQFYG